MSKIKVLIVDDSAFMRKLISEFLAEDSRIEVIGTARNGRDAVNKIEKEKPDVITLDVEMPIMDGLEALQIIMKQTPTAVIMLSSTTKEGADNTLKAMEIGAIDFIAKPSGAISLDLYKIKTDLINKIVAASKTNVSKLQKNTLNIEIIQRSSDNYSKIELVHDYNLSPQISEKSPFSKKIIVIGTSTGGPRALQTVLTQLPKNIEAPILVVQHMPPGFTKSLANRLNTLSEITVKEAEDGEILKKGTAYIARGGHHLKIKKVGMSLAIHTDQSPMRNGHRPSVDVLFESVSRINDVEKVAVVMTGMGMDGANGLIALSKSGRLSAIAESEKTSIVFGMPKAAIATNVINKVANVEDIAKAIVKYC
ncbi:protein-glutamate methylesterase/protein-glutamine glutaminase [Peribacillus loiseleuriae]|uniref:Protein-glutamate methylesterase/protein-glutamine glutaminase n=1 Tax=Peribacillus loiseleuriae TaxID=1679170 RepID=A0A0K9GS60_9BACI|nr:chemotaxis response regulator protein-glutamate methylesterase [Peribacillus loiseleuriae]KMY49466.1 chemotaxis protein CheY [Peribacillus loiseleuriae]